MANQIQPILQKKINSQAWLVVALIGFIVIGIIVAAAYLFQSNKNYLPITIQKEKIISWQAISRNYTMHMVDKKVIIDPHLIGVNGGSDIHVSASLEKNNTIMILEEEVKGNSISQQADGYRVSETIDVSSLTPGSYMLLINNKVWSAGLLQEKQGWQTKPVFQSIIQI